MLVIRVLKRNKVFQGEVGIVEIPGTLEAQSKEI